MKLPGACLLLAALLLAFAASAEEAPGRLAPGVPVERELAGGETRSYATALAAGGHLLVTVDQRGMDVEIGAFGPGGESLGAVDTPTGREGSESMLVSAGAAGDYRIAVRSLGREDPPGRFEIRAELLSTGTPAERERIEAERLATEAKVLAQQEGAAPGRAALGRYGEVLKLFRKLGSRSREAETLDETTAFLRPRGEKRRALESLGASASLWQALGNPGRQAGALSKMGLCRWELGEIPQAFALHQARGDRAPAHDGGQHRPARVVPRRPPAGPALSWQQGDDDHVQAEPRATSPRPDPIRKEIAR